MVDVTGLRRPFTRKFNGKTYHIDNTTTDKKVANKIAKSIRKGGRKVRVVKRTRVVTTYAVYTASK